MQFLRILYIVLGTISLILGLIGIVVPGLPTTPFVLLTAWLYLKGSKKLHSKLLSNRYLGKYIENFEKNKGVKLKTKILAIAMMWTMITISCSFFIDTTPLQYVVISMGMIGTLILVIFVKTIP